MRLSLLMASAAALMTAACDGEGSRVSTVSISDDGGPLKVVTTLQCPQTQGPLTRKGGPAADGLSCDYAGPRGSEVTLHLVALDGADATEALKPFETRLSSELPAAEAQLASAPMDQAADAAVDVRSETVDGVEHAEVRMPGVDIQAKGDDAVVRLPGMSIDASGDKAIVRIGGLQINADDASEKVSITTEDEALDIQAHGDATVVRTRAPGKSIRANFILTDGSGEERGLWRVVGYEARGPSGGPIVVATVKSKGRNEDGLFDAARDLVRLNVGD